VSWPGHHGGLPPKCFDEREILPKSYVRMCGAGVHMHMAVNEGETLQYDPTAYDCLHQLTIEWPSLR
jgi:hypothetical protein